MLGTHAFLASSSRNSCGSATIGMLTCALTTQHPLCVDRSNTGREAAAASSRRADKREKDRQPISWQDWAKHAKPGDASQQESERPKRSREQSPQHRHIDRTDERGGMRVVIPHPSDTRTLHRSLPDLLHLWAVAYNHLSRCRE